MLDIPFKAAQKTSLARPAFLKLVYATKILEPISNIQYTQPKNALEQQRIMYCAYDESVAKKPIIQVYPRAFSPDMIWGRSYHETLEDFLCTLEHELQHARDVRDRPEEMFSEDSLHQAEAEVRATYAQFGMLKHCSEEYRRRVRSLHGKNIATVNRLRNTSQ